jgi:hypothetical protein
MPNNTYAVKMIAAANAEWTDHVLHTMSEASFTRLAESAALRGQSALVIDFL